MDLHQRIINLQQKMISLEIKNENLSNTMETMYLIFCGILMTLVQVGFACLESACVHRKNTVNMVFSNILCLFVCMISYWLWGHGLMFGDGNMFVGYKNYFASWVDEDKQSSWFIEYLYSSTAATVVSGAMAERCDFFAYIIYSVIISGFTYPIAARWAMDNGFFKVKWEHFTDTSGSGSIHLLPGVCAFFGAIIIGPRKGRFSPGYECMDQTYRTVIVASGLLFIITGFLALTGVSRYKMRHPIDGELAANSIINTIMGGCGGALFMLTIGKIGILDGRPRWPLLRTTSGIITGMISVSGANEQYTRLYAIIIGIIGGLIYFNLQWIIPRIKVDDPVEATAIHFGGGLWGLWAVPIFSHGGFWKKLIDKDRRKEFIYGILANFMGSICIIIWGILNAIIIFGFLKFINILRVSDEYEDMGLDASQHKEYDIRMNESIPININEQETLQNIENNLGKRNILVVWWNQF